MALIEWTDDYSVSVEEIDLQHKKIIEMINTLHQAMLDGKGHKIISGILDGLAEYAVYHFQTEEKYFDKFNFEGGNTHKETHNEFVKQISEFMDGYKSGDLMLTIDVMDFLSDWLQNHILGEDMEYSDFFVEHGLS
jgi:hemerythrin